MKRWEEPLQTISPTWLRIAYCLLLYCTAITASCSRQVSMDGFSVGVRGNEKYFRSYSARGWLWIPTNRHCWPTLMMTSRQGSYLREFQTSYLGELNLWNPRIKYWYLSIHAQLRTPWSLSNFSLCQWSLHFSAEAFISLPIIISRIHHRSVSNWQTKPRNMKRSKRTISSKNK